MGDFILVAIFSKITVKYSAAGDLKESLVILQTDSFRFVENHMMAHAGMVLALDVRAKGGTIR